MKLYYFDPCDYGGQAFVLAESPEKAKEYLLKYKKEPKFMFEDDDRIDMNQFQNEEIDDMVNLRQKYKLREYNIGEVVFSEIS
jgi:hypothetical protein